MDRSVILEALIPGRMQGHARAAEVPEKLRERAVRMVLNVRDRDGKGRGSSPGWPGSIAEPELSAVPAV